MKLRNFILSTTIASASLVAVFYAAGAPQEEAQSESVIDQPEIEPQETFVDRLPAGLMYGGMIGGLSFGALSMLLRDMMNDDITLSGPSADQAHPDGIYQYIEMTPPGIVEP